VLPNTIFTYCCVYTQRQTRIPNRIIVGLLPSTCIRHVNINNVESCKTKRRLNFALRFVLEFSKHSFFDMHIRLTFSYEKIGPTRVITENNIFFKFVLKHLDRSL
jgi:hypothetical protein